MQFFVLANSITYIKYYLRIQNDGDDLKYSHHVFQDNSRTISMETLQSPKTNVHRLKSIRQVIRENNNVIKLVIGLSNTASIFTGEVQALTRSFEEFSDLWKSVSISQFLKE